MERPWVSLDTPSRLVIAFPPFRVPRGFSPRFGRPLAGPSPPALASRRDGLQFPVQLTRGMTSQPVSHVVPILALARSWSTSCPPLGARPRLSLHAVNRAVCSGSSNKE
jgi:hypothetical protein